MTSWASCLLLSRNQIKLSGVGSEYNDPGKQILDDVIM